jgi:uncharacterized protein with HEPN domain
MNEKDDLVYIKHVMDAIGAVREYTKDMTLLPWLENKYLYRPKELKVNAIKFK